MEASCAWKHQVSQHVDGEGLQIITAEQLGPVLIMPSGMSRLCGRIKLQPDSWHLICLVVVESSLVVWCKPADCRRTV